MAQLMAHATRGALASNLAHERACVKALPRPALAPYSHAPSAPLRAGSSHSPVARRSVLAKAVVEKINGEQLEVAIASRETTLIIDFYATWCGPCLLLARELEQVAESYEGKVKVVKIDVDENPDLSAMLKIQGLPTIVIIPKENGKPALRTEGLLPAAQIMEIVDQLEAGTLQQAPAPQQQ